MAASKKTVAKKRTVAAPVEEEVSLNQPDTNDIPTPKAPPAIVPRMIKDAIDAGLPDMPKNPSEAYAALYETYVRFIRQSPEKWEADKEELLAKLEALA